MPAISTVKRAAARAYASDEALKTAICRAHSEGASLRAIAQAAGMSHEQVRRIVSR